MIMKYLAFIFLIVTGSYANAQFGFMKRSDIELLENDTLIVVLRSDSLVSNYLQYAVENNWTLSPYKFIREKELGNHYQNRESVFMLGHFNGMFYLDPSGADNVDFIGIVSKAYLSSSIPLENRKDIQTHLFFNPNSSSIGIMCGYIRALNSYLRKIKSRSVNSQTSYIKHIRSMKSYVSGKKILIDFKRDFHVSKTELKIKKLYLIKESSKEDISSALLTKQDAVFFLPFHAGGRYFLYLISCRDGTICYYTHVRDLPGLQKASENKMLKSIE